MKKFGVSLFALVLAGCLGAPPKPPVNWTIEVASGARVASVAVCAPYGGQRLAVLRHDGSIAFDPCNSFAAAPAAILRDAIASRRGEGALVVRRLALDCRAQGQRDAVVELEIALGERIGRGASAEPTADGNYTAAFSSAFEKAYAQALKELESAK